MPKKAVLVVIDVTSNAPFCRVESPATASDAALATTLPLTQYDALKACDLTPEATSQSQSSKVNTQTSITWPASCAAESQHVSACYYWGLRDVAFAQLSEQEKEHLKFCAAAAKGKQGCLYEDANELLETKLVDPILKLILENIHPDIQYLFDESHRESARHRKKLKDALARHISIVVIEFVNYIIDDANTLCMTLQMIAVNALEDACNNFAKQLSDPDRERLLTNRDEKGNPILTDALLTENADFSLSSELEQNMLEFTKLIQQCLMIEYQSQELSTSGQPTYHFADLFTENSAIHFLLALYYKMHRVCTHFHDKNVVFVMKGSDQNLYLLQSISKVKNFWPIAYFRFAREHSEVTNVEALDSQADCFTDVRPFFTLTGVLPKYNRLVDDVDRVDAALLQDAIDRTNQRSLHRLSIRMAAMIAGRRKKMTEATLRRQVVMSNNIYRTEMSRSSSLQALSRSRTNSTSSSTSNEAASPKQFIIPLDKSYEFAFLPSTPRSGRRFQEKGGNAPSATTNEAPNLSTYSRQTDYTFPDYLEKRFEEQDDVTVCGKFDTAQLIGLKLASTRLLNSEDAFYRIMNLYLRMHHLFSIFTPRADKPIEIYLDSTNSALLSEISHVFFFDSLIPKGVKLMVPDHTKGTTTWKAFSGTGPVNTTYIDTVERVLTEIKNSQLKSKSELPLAILKNMAPRRNALVTRTPTMPVNPANVDHVASFRKIIRNHIRNGSFLAMVGETAADAIERLTPHSARRKPTDPSSGPSQKK